MSRDEIVNDAKPLPGFSSAPYHVEVFPIGATICRTDGLNCLTFTSKPGATFTTPDVAQAICDKWNKEDAT